MSIASDLQTIAANVPLVFLAGKDAQYDAFWDDYQQSGSRTNYQFAFAGRGWTDDVFDPKYAITVSDNSLAQQMFYDARELTEIGAALTILGSSNNVFANCRALKTIADLTVGESTVFTTWFTNCYDLENVTIHGTVANDLDIHYSTNLTLASAKSILTALKSGVSGKTLTLPTALQSAVSADGTASGLVTAAQSGGWTVAYA